MFQGVILYLLLLPLFACAFYVLVELARTAVARAGKIRIERYPIIRMMKLPADNGPRWARIGTIVVGPLAMYVAIAALAFGVFWCNGVTRDAGPCVVDEAIAGGAAAGVVQPGDRIIDIDGQPVAMCTQSLRLGVNARRGAPVTLGIERDGRRESVAIQPRANAQGGWQIGIRATVEPDRAVGAAAGKALAYPLDQARAIGRGLVEVVSGREEVDPGGPTRIVAEFRERSSVTIAQLAMVLGVYALFPLLLLDVVRLALLAFRRRA